MENSPDENKPQLIPRLRNPDNLESPFSYLDGILTPTELFYVRSHFPVPELTREDYELRIDGAIENTVRMSYNQIRSVSATRFTATLECAGNGRAFLQPVPSGVPWERGAVSTAEWEGILLSDLLKKAKVDPKACEAVFIGADSGEVKTEAKPPCAIHYARSIPMERALKTLLAYRMNGEDLSLAHGFPLRAIVPGYYAMASVKWLTHIEIVTKPFTGYWQTIDYAYWTRDPLSGEPMRMPLGEMKLKSLIARPSPKEKVKVGETCRVFGAAWSGESAVVQVDFSDDGGKSWKLTKLLSHTNPHAWRLWQYDWTPKEAGTVQLMSRARNQKGEVQPEKHNPDMGSYAIHHIVPIEVQIVL